MYIRPADSVYYHRWYMIPNEFDLTNWIVFSFKWWWLADMRTFHFWPANRAREMSDRMMSKKKFLEAMIGHDWIINNYCWRWGQHKPFVILTWLSPVVSSCVYYASASHHRLAYQKIQHVNHCLSTFDIHINVMW